jgi:hypothetical protein
LHSLRQGSNKQIARHWNVDPGCEPALAQLCFCVPGSRKDRKRVKLATAIFMRGQSTGGHDPAHCFIRFCFAALSTSTRTRPSRISRKHEEPKEGPDSIAFERKATDCTRWPFGACSRARWTATSRNNNSNPVSRIGSFTAGNLDQTKSIQGLMAR